MTSFLNLETQREAGAAAADSQKLEQDSALGTSRSTGEEPVDFEIVLGRRQIASTGLVLMVALACFSGVSYLIGKAAASKASVPPAAVAAHPAAPVPSLPAAPAAPIPSVQAPAAPAPVAQAPVTQAPPSQAEAAPKEPPPLFAEAVTGNVYLQVGAVEKGLAAVWAEGLRTHGLEAFVSTGPSDKMWRVLIGPLPDPEAYHRAKDTLDTLGLTNFGRRYTR